MQMTKVRRIFSLLLCVMLTAAAAFTVTGCNETGKRPDTPVTEEVTEEKRVTEVGKGQTSFSFDVFDASGNVTSFKVRTDKKTVGDALSELGLIEGTREQYGLYVKKVNGIYAEFEKTGTYWAFYVDGEYAVSGVDSTAIEEGKTYSFRVEKQ